MKATEQCFPVVLFTMLYKMVLTFESVDEALKCDHSNESYWAVLSCGAVYYAIQCDSDTWKNRFNKLTLLSTSLELFEEIRRADWGEERDVGAFVAPLFVVVTGFVTRITPSTPCCSFLTEGRGEGATLSRFFCALLNRKDDCSTLLPSCDILFQ